MKKTLIVLSSLLLMLALAVPASAKPAQYVGYPIFYISTVVQDSNVTIQGYNFPAGDTFVVTMGPYGTYGIGGIVVDSTYSGGGGSFSMTYPIPAALAGSAMISIRLQSPYTGYYAYNWFYNNPSGSSAPPAPVPPTPPGYYGYPYFFIQAVERDKKVTIKGYNFPPNDKFTVTMNYYGTYGIGGHVVDYTTTGAGGTFVMDYPVPAALAGLERIAIRLESPTTGYYAFNWFWNFNANVSLPPAPPPVTPPPPSYVGYPYFFISSVQRDNSVTIAGYNFPPGDNFTVTMGPYGGYGIGGIVVDTTSSGTGGMLAKTYSIPAGLAGSQRIAIRLQSPTTGYYAYNWFWNYTAFVP